MKKSKVFLVNKSHDKVEADINVWLAENSEKVIVSTAGTHVLFIVIYEE